MLYSPKLFFKDRLVASSLAISLLIQAITWWLTISKIHPTDEPLFLHYNIMFSIDLVGEWWKLYLPPAIGFGFLIVNTIISWLTYGSYRTMSRVLIVFLPFIVAALLIGQTLLINLNI